MKKLTKARSDAVQALFKLAWTHEQYEGDRPQQQALVRFAHEHELLHLLPDEAHSEMHHLAIPHKHDGMEEDHEHEVVKAYNPIGKSWLVEKAWGGDDNDAFIEGWLSTPDEDIQRDVIEPEAFLGSVDSYFSRRAPISFVHYGKTLPAGHLQRAAIVRDGQILKSVGHPTDAADFEHFPGRGTGVFVRGRLTDEKVSRSVRKGDVGGFSFIGNGKKYTPRPPKGNHYTEIDPWIESTVAPYPINHQAVILVAKAYGLEEEEKSMPESDLVAALRALLDEKQEKPVAKTEVTMEALEFLLTSHKDTLLKEVDTRLTKAVELVREEGKGSQATIVKSVLPEENPLFALLQKAESDLSADERNLIGEATVKILSKGMNGSASDEIRYF